MPISRSDSLVKSFNNITIGKEKNYDITVKEFLKILCENKIVIFAHKFKEDNITFNQFVRYLEKKFKHRYLIFDEETSRDFKLQISEYLIDNNFINKDKIFKKNKDRILTLEDFKGCLIKWGFMDGFESKKPLKTYLLNTLPQHDYDKYIILKYRDNKYHENKNVYVPIVVYPYNVLKEFGIDMGCKNDKNFDREKFLSRYEHNWNKYNSSIDYDGEAQQFINNLWELFERYLFEDCGEQNEYKKNIGLYEYLKLKHSKNTATDISEILINPFNCIIYDMERMNNYNYNSDEMNDFFSRFEKVLFFLITEGEEGDIISLDLVATYEDDDKHNNCFTFYVDITKIQKRTR